MCKLRLSLHVFVLGHQERTYEHWWFMSVFVLQSQITGGGDSKADVLIQDIKR